MRQHSYIFDRHNIFNPENGNFESKISRLKKLLKDCDFSLSGINDKTIDNILNNIKLIKKNFNKNIDRKIVEDIVINKEYKDTNVSKHVIDNKLYIDLEILRRRDDEFRIKGEQTDVISGFLYILMHPLYPGWFKVGMTVDFKNRLRTYNTGDPFSKYEFVVLKNVKNRCIAERILINELLKHCADSKGEWFKIEKNVILEEFNKIS